LGVTAERILDDGADLTRVAELVQCGEEFVAMRAVASKRSRAGFGDRSRIAEPIGDYTAGQVEVAHLAVLVACSAFVNMRTRIERAAMSPAACARVNTGGWNASWSPHVRGAASAVE
jgi:hypothetical protein